MSLTPADAELVAGRVAELLAERAAAPLVDAKAAAAFLSVPESWVLAEARADRIPHVRLGRYVRFDVETLRTWRAGRACGPRVRTGSGPVSGSGERR